MGIDFKNLKVPGQLEKPTDPIEIFRASAIADGNINDLWLAQGDALREWNDHRDKGDVAVVLNTGAGKTLVGLLIAQSLVNETKGQVVYACSSIQLIEQTAEKARGYGLPTTTYHSGCFSDNQYNRAEAPCVTTYQALFNGRTRFRTDQIEAAIFDDAHTAEHILRDQFSMTISRQDMVEVYEQIVYLFRPFHDSVGMAMSYEELSSGSSSRQFFVPPFELQRNIGELRRILRKANLSEVDRTKFSWEHLKDHVDLCCLLITYDGITLTPPVLPAFTLPYFRKEVRRVYLSATMRAPDSFVRAFGRKPDKLVAPSTKAGECERMILVPSSVSSVKDDVKAAKEVIHDEKALIIVPSFSRAKEWEDIAPAPRRGQVPNEVAAFKQAPHGTKLTLAARYDGIDLPGDTCRMMVIDDLPKGAGPWERYQWEKLNMHKSLRSMIATRIVQSFGRISRGMSDHGVVILTGKSLIDWLNSPRNRSLLPGFLQKQIDLGMAVSKTASDTDDLRSAATYCLRREPDWVSAYTGRMKELPTHSQSENVDQELEISVAEAKFGEALWDRDFLGAASALNAVIEDAFKLSQYTGAWLNLWLGFALEMGGDKTSPVSFYNRAHAEQPNIPRPPSPQSATEESIPKQVDEVYAQMQPVHSGSNSIGRKHSDLKHLDGKGSSQQVEEALRCLGTFLGLNSSRPDKEFDRGPDVLWIGEEGYAVCMEVKTGKCKTSRYNKKDVGQLYNHVQWVRNERGISEVLPVFIGPQSQATENASPSPEMKVIELSQFEELGQRFLSALEDAGSQAPPSSLASTLYDLMKNRGLLYPGVLESLEMTALNDVTPMSR